MNLSELFETFIDYLDESIKPWVVVDPYECAVIFRLGKLHKERSEGFWLKLPFIDRSELVTTSITSLRTPAQSVHTKSGLRHFRLSIQWRVVHPARFLINVSAEENYLRDLVCARVSEMFSREEEGDNFASMIRRARAEALNTAGIDLMRLRMVDDIHSALPIRILGDGVELLDE